VPEFTVTRELVEQRSKGQVVRLPSNHEDDNHQATA
jgi:hypothetical protein